jgi:hypothetical protein
MPSYNSQEQASPTWLYKGYDDDDGGSGDDGIVLLKFSHNGCHYLHEFVFHFLGRNIHSVSRNGI